MYSITFIARRRALRRTAATLVSVWAPIIFAQQAQLSIRARLDRHRRDALSLQAEVRDIGFKLTPGDASRQLAVEFHLRSEAAQTLWQVPQSELQFFSLPEQTIFLDQMRTLEVPLLPTPAELSLVTLQEPQIFGKCKETSTSVVADIIIDAVGLQAVRELLILVVSKTPVLQKILNQLATAVDLRDAEQVIKLVALFFDVVAQLGAASHFVGIVGPKEARRLWHLVLVKLGSRLVPFIGQAYAVSCVAIAIFQNLQRLQDTFDCPRK